MDEPAGSDRAPRRRPSEPARRPGRPGRPRGERASGAGTAGERAPGAAATGTSPPPPSRQAREARVRPPTRRVALVIAAAVVLAVALWMGRAALGPFVVGLLLVYLLAPAVERLARTGLPRWLSVLAIYAVVAVVVWQLLGLMIRPVVEQIRALVDDLPSLGAQLDGLYRGLDLPPQLREWIDHWLAGLGEGNGVDPGILLPVVNLTAGVVSGFFGFLIIPVWAFYLLKDRPQIMTTLDRSLPDGWRRDVWEVAAIVDRVFGQWVRGQLFLGLTVGVATFAGLLILNVAIDPIFGRFALLLAIIAGVLELLPIIGPIIAAVPAVLLALTAGPQAAIAALILYTLVQQVENNVLVPKIQGDAVELHPSAVMFALVVGGAIAGLLGAILALPVTAASRDVFRYLFRRLSEDAPDGRLSAADATGG